MSINGKTIVITRDPNQAKTFAKMIEEAGAHVYLFPIIKITGPDDPDLVRKNLKDLKIFNWIVFTSANAVRYFFKFIAKDRSDVIKLKIACVGKKTAEELKTFNLEPFVIPQSFNSQDLLAEILKHDLKGERILLPVSNLSGSELQEGLQAQGAAIERIEIYKNEPIQTFKRKDIIQKIENNSIDCITFFSPSAINAFIDLINKKGISLIQKRKIPIAVIGKTTAQAARDRDLYPDIMPAKSDEESFVKELERYFE